MYLPTYFQLREYIQNVFRTSIFMGFFVTCTRFYVRSRGSFLSSTTFQYKVLLNNLVLMMPIIFLLQIHRSTNRKGEGFRNQTPFRIHFNFLNLYIGMLYFKQCPNLSSNFEKILYSIKVKSLPRCYVWAQVYTLSPLLNKGYLI